MPSFWRDLRHALRFLRLSPGFPLVAVLTLALGTGANTAIFQLIDSIRLRTIPAKNPQELGTIRIADRHWGSGQFSSQYSQLTFAMWEQIRKRQEGFAEIAVRSEEHTSELQSRLHLVCRLLLDQKTVYKIPRDRFALRCFMMRSLFGGFLSLCFLASTTFAQSNPCSLSDHTEYTKQIKEFTTESFFSTELVDHLPLSSCVPAPDVFFQNILGPPDFPHFPKAIHSY